MTDPCGEDGGKGSESVQGAVLHVESHDASAGTWRKETKEREHSGRDKGAREPGKQATRQHQIKA